ncbi:hypothetical protein PsorP6_011409 [Peronosclerospora sorghi]|uniref:Uncharacterized protein n=1 Tax=Peronosclerospora sorghi TaxID=230839 RepID=A0ACC0WK22_9STRA|nr:hypothetical protein PsorP6_011409 [Peronosclerospora sorghi]
MHHLRAEVKEVAWKHQRDAEVWRVEWNVTGTMLASSGDAGTTYGCGRAILKTRKATTRFSRQEGVFSVDELKQVGVQHGWCPYFTTRSVVTFVDVVVYTYQYMLDPTVSQLVLSGYEKESIVVFNEAHNIDNVCIEALRVELNRRALDRASRNLTALSTQVTKLKQADKARLDAEYRRLVEGLRARNAVVAPTYTYPVTHEVLETSHDIMLANPVLPDDVWTKRFPATFDEPSISSRSCVD